MQRHLKGWNWEVFGDIRTKLHETRCKIEDLEGRTQQAYVEEEAKELNMLKIEMTRLLKWETDILYQKNREKWVTEGDRNTKFFHALIKERRRRNTIKITNPDGSVLTDSQQILAGAVCHFQSLFTASPFQLQEELFHEYPAPVTTAMNTVLESLPTSAEVLESLNVSPQIAPLGRMGLRDTSSEDAGILFSMT